MKQCALLSMDRLDDFVCYDELLVEPMAQFGWYCETLSWRSNADWDRYDAVLIRSPWDYQLDAPAFIEVLCRIDASRARLENSLPLVLWNLRKTYLRDLEQAGIDIVPTIWGEDFEQVRQELERLEDWPQELILKPQISANADDTFRLDRASLLRQSGRFADLFRDRPCMLQPFLPAIVEEGEYSLFHFGGEYSHAILKTPKGDDFRVQEEHGGRLQAIDPEAELRAASEEILEAITRLQQQPLYARIDLVRHQGRFLVMEVELIEPSLYFNMDPMSAMRFTRAFLRRMEETGD